MADPEPATCPACDAYTAAVAVAAEEGSPCPHCGFPSQAFGVLADAESRGYRRPVIAALVDYGRRTVAAETRVDHLEEDLAAALADRHRERERVTATRAELDQIRAAQAGTVERLNRELREARWRLDQIRIGIGGYLLDPVPEHVIRQVT